MTSIYSKFELPQRSSVKKYETMVHPIVQIHLFIVFFVRMYANVIDEICRYYVEMDLIANTLFQSWIQLFFVSTSLR